MGEYLHIGVIMDGNRRYAKKLGRPSSFGHYQGAKKLRKFIDWMKELSEKYKIKYATFYSLSTENIKNRKKEEIEYLFKLFKKEFSKILNPRHDVHKDKVRVRIIGRKDMLPKDLRELFRKVEQATKKYSKFYLNFAIAYGGRQEIVDMVKKISKKIKNGKIKIGDINEKIVEENLYTDGIPPVDIIIRTGGEERISNFLLWQSAYAELFFLKKFWPEIEKKDLENILKKFYKRQRRFGK